MEDPKTEAGVIAALAFANEGPQRAADGAVPFVLTPEGYRVTQVEDHLPAPTRMKGTTKLRDAASFIAFVNRLKTSATVLYRVTHPTPRFTAVFNDDAPGQPGWGDHVAVYECPLSPEWVEWSKASGRQMSQQDFAQFIERNLPDLVAVEGGPTPAQMLEVSRTLQAKKKVNFASGTRLDNGEVQFRYEEQIEGTAGKGDIKVPEQFRIGVPVFEGGDGYGVIARLRYRIGDRGDLTMWFDLERPHKIIEDAVKRLSEVVEKGCSLPLFNGSPSSEH